MTKRYGTMKEFRRLSREYGPFDTDQHPRELLHMLQSEGLLEEVQFTESLVSRFLARELDDEKHAGEIDAD